MSIGRESTGDKYSPELGISELRAGEKEEGI